MSDNQERTVTYRGHEISARAVEVRPGGWAWSYLVDGRINGGSKRPNLTGAEMALRQAIAAGEARVDEMDGPVSAKGRR